MQPISNRLEPGYVLPNQKIPKILGMLNITFGVGLVLVALGFAGFVWLFPGVLDAGIGPQATISPNNVKIGINSKTSTTGQVRSVETLALAGVVSPKPHATAIGRRQIVFWVEVSLAILLNLAMIVSGFGLIHLKNWARKLAIWVAGLKIARMLALALITIFLFIPEEMRANVRGDGAPIVINNSPRGTKSQTSLNVQSPAGLIAVFETTEAAGEFVVGSIYPVIVLILLTRISVWAACIAAERQRQAGAKPVIIKPGTSSEI